MRTPRWPIGDEAERRVRPLTRQELRLAIPKGRDHGDDFYRQVADLYGRLAAQGHT